MPRLPMRGLIGGFVLAGLLLVLTAWIVGARQDALAMDCGFNMRQVALAVLQFANSKGTFPPGTAPEAGVKPEDRWGWPVSIQGFFQDSGVLPNLDHAGNPMPVDRGKYTILQCRANPNQTLPNGDGLIHFVGIAGLGKDSPTLALRDPRIGVFGYDRTASLAEVTDGASNTMMLAETADANGPWFMGGRATVRGLDPERQPYLGAGRQFGGTHRGGANVAMVDGSVKFIRDSISPKVFEAMSTIAGNEPAGINEPGDR